MKYLTFAITAGLLAGCILGKDDDKKQPKFNQFTISGPLEGLHYEHAPPLDFWDLKIDTIYPGREDIYTGHHCTANGYLGNADTTDYTNSYMTPSYLISPYFFSAPSDTALARNFTHWRLNITCPDSIPMPQ